MATIHVITIKRKLGPGTSEDVPEQQDILLVISQCTLRFIGLQGIPLRECRTENTNARIRP